MVLKGYTKTKKVGTFRRLALAWWDAPNDGRIHGTMFLDVKNALELIKKVEAEQGLKLTVNHFLGKAVALGLKESPMFNAKLIWGTFYEKDSVDIFFQVDVEGGKDLSGVIVEGAENKSVIDIAKELRDAANKLRKGDDKQYEKTQKGLFSRLPTFALRLLFNFLLFLKYNIGMDLNRLGVKDDPFGTVMISNVGPFGVDIAYAPIVTPARVPLVVLVGRVQDTPVAIDGKVVIRPILTGNATFDHRYGDGYHIGKLIRKVREFMESPYLEAHPPTGYAPGASQGTPITPGSEAAAAVVANASSGNGAKS